MENQAGIHAIASLGPKTAEEIHKHVEALYAEQLDLWGKLGRKKYIDEHLIEISTAFRSSGWSDEESAHALLEFFTICDERGISIQNDNDTHVNFGSFKKWIFAHADSPDRFDGIKECLRIGPQSDISITKLLSKRGNHKLIFLATWLTIQREVVLKKIKEEHRETASGESFSNPLSIKHRK
jgi:hypothetical protein